MLSSIASTTACSGVGRPTEATQPDSLADISMLPENTATRREAMSRASSASGAGAPAVAPLVSTLSCTRPASTWVVRSISIPSAPSSMAVTRLIITCLRTVPATATGGRPSATETRSWAPWLVASGRTSRRASSTTGATSLTRSAKASPNQSISRAMCCEALLEVRLAPASSAGMGGKEVRRIAASASTAAVCSRRKCRRLMPS